MVLPDKAISNPIGVPMGQIERIERRLKPHDMPVRLRRQLVRLEQSENRLDLVEIRVGDALKTLSVDLPETIDLLLLDGAKPLYPEVLAWWRAGCGRARSNGSRQA